MLPESGPTQKMIRNHRSLETIKTLTHIDGLHGQVYLERPRKTKHAEAPAIAESIGRPAALELDDVIASALQQATQ